MKDKTELLLRRWGQQIERARDGTQWKAFLQPVRENNRQESEAVTAVGAVDWRRWLYIGPAEIPLDEGEILLWGGERYVVRERTAVQLGTVQLGERAILVKAKEAAL